MARRLDHVDGMMACLVLVWGTAFPAIRVLGQALDPFQITWFRYALFPLAYGLFLLVRRRAALRGVTGNEWVAIAVLGFLGVIGYHFPLNWGLHGPDGVSGATGAILVATGPIFTLLVAVAVGKERLRGAAVAGSLVAFGGVTVIVLYGRGEADLELAGRSAVMLLAPVSWAVYSVYAKGLVARHGGLATTGLTMGVGTLMLLPLGVHYGAAPLVGMGTGPWLALAFLALLSTLAGYAVWNYALKHRSASDVAVFVYAQPIVSTVVGYLWLGEAITWPFVVGSALVLAGVVVVNRARWSAHAAPTPAGAPDVLPGVAGSSEGGVADPALAGRTGMPPAPKP